MGKENVRGQSVLGVGGRVGAGLCVFFVGGKLRKFIPFLPSFNRKREAPWDRVFGGANEQENKKEEEKTKNITEKILIFPIWDGAKNPPPKLRDSRDFVSQNSV
eukprot:TRINITY_DN1641_c7_g1_i1.p2 TRINITY_DN1641_c7_g1~~TRINITY_DN1641_c7_g1_i1.p2  ORF type:complete len:104 (-),score=2.13 TRINITY_DN1641_c7_g1_i1:34-345(-)